MPSTTTTIEIEGMHCEGCAERIDTVLRRLDGVSEADVSLAAGRARVRHDADEAPVEALLRAIGRAGYGARVREGGDA